MKIKALISILIGSFAGGAFAQMGVPYIGVVANAAQYFQNILFGNSPSTPPFPGGPLGANALSVTNGTSDIWDNNIYGWGCSAAVFGVIGNKPSSFNCQIAGNFTNPYGPADYTIRPQVGVYSQINGAPALFGSLSGGFTTTRFVPAVVLNSTQLASLRVGMPIDSNDATPWSGIISGWDQTGGTYVTVQGWYQQGDGTHTPGTPSGTAAKISPFSKIWGLNVVTVLTPTSEQTAQVNEIDCFNQTGAYNAVTDTPHTDCLDLTSAGGTASATFGIDIRGTFINGINMGAGTFSNAPISVPFVTPANSSAACTTGGVNWDTNFMYLCTATNTWKRATLSTF